MANKKIELMVNDFIFEIFYRRIRKNKKHLETVRENLREFLATDYDYIPLEDGENVLEALDMVNEAVYYLNKILDNASKFKQE